MIFNVVPSAVKLYVSPRNMKHIVAIAILLTSMQFVVSEETLPPKSVRAEWSELDALKFSEWRITEFNGWAIPFDGGSKVFFFKSHTGKIFDVVAANPAYWTKEDKKARRQIFYVIHNKKFYRLEEGSAAEKSLISMLQAALPQLAGTGKKDPKLIDQLLERIKNRKPMFQPKRG